MFYYLYRYSTVFSYFQLAFLDVIVKIGIGDLSTDSKALYIIIIMFKEILIGYIANQWNPFPCCVLVQAAMDLPVIFKWTLFSYKNPVYLNLWLWSIYITCVFCLYLLLFIFLLIQLLFFTLYMHVNVKHVNTFIYTFQSLTSIWLWTWTWLWFFSALILSLLPYCQVYWQSFEMLLTDKNLSL